MALSLDKVAQQAPDLLSMAKTARQVIGSSLPAGTTARVALCLDVSVSMTNLYADNTVQNAAERILALSTGFDDDGAIDVYTFGARARHVGQLTLLDYKGGIDRLRGPLEYGTDYGAAVEEIISHSFKPVRKGPFGKKTVDRSTVYVAFFTDGDTQNRSGASKAFRDASVHPAFFQTVGLGNLSFDFLNTLDTLSGRVVDNVGFMHIPDIATISDTDLFDGMLNEFPDYLIAARAAGVLTS